MDWPSVGGPPRPPEKRPGPGRLEPCRPPSLDKYWLISIRTVRQDRCLTGWASPCDPGRTCLGFPSLLVSTDSYDTPAQTTITYIIQGRPKVCPSQLLLSRPVAAQNPELLSSFHRGSSYILLAMALQRNSCVGKHTTHSVIRTRNSPQTAPPPSAIRLAIWKTGELRARGGVGCVYW